MHDVHSQIHGFPDACLPSLADVHVLLLQGTTVSPGERIKQCSTLCLGEALASSAKECFAGCIMTRAQTTTWIPKHKRWESSCGSSHVWLRVPSLASWLYDGCLYSSSIVRAWSWQTSARSKCCTCDPESRGCCPKARVPNYFLFCCRRMKMPRKSLPKFKLPFR